MSHLGASDRTSLAHAPSSGSALWVTGLLRYHPGLLRVSSKMEKSLLLFSLARSTWEVYQVLLVEISMGSGDGCVYDVYFVIIRGSYIPF